MTDEPTTTPAEPLSESERDELLRLRAERDETERLCSAVTHELRSPISAILTFASLLAMDSPDGLDRRARDLVTRLTESARHTVHIMDRLSQLSHVGRQALTMVPIDPRTEVEAIFLERTRMLGGLMPSLALHDLPAVVADKALFRVLLENLVDNAIKCSSHRTESCIEAGGSTDADEVVLFVRDNGMGFDERQAGQLFTLFGHIHSQKDVPGAGVGLAIVQRIAQRHGGRTWAEGRPDSGATFHVALPRVPRQAVSEALLAE